MTLRDQQEYSNNIKDYSLVETIGQGGFGIVSCAIHQPTNERVAIKIVYVFAKKIDSKNNNEAQQHDGTSTQRSRDSFTTHTRQYHQVDQLF